eukprot:TRINITY_DN876_c0_g1_i3.p1 TRINITY_DN876_c0_g1~~TRINITY_DN876_c0_g1_i3.p1  ORF type:complete len:103 (+),score=10.84 TRINITY_DN876_c0_g1_i3:1387-1695(+)
MLYFVGFVDKRCSDEWTMDVAKKPGLCWMNKSIDYQLMTSSSLSRGKSCRKMNTSSTASSSRAKLFLSISTTVGILHSVGTIEQIPSEADSIMRRSFDQLQH